MEARLFSIARWFLPELATMRGRERTYGVADVLGTLYSAPLAIVALVWLVSITDTFVLRDAWPILLLQFILLFVFESLDFFVFVEVTPGTYADWTWSLGSVMVCSTALMIGANALWALVFWRLISFARKFLQANQPDWRWNLLRNLTLDLATFVLGGLIAMRCYTVWGGVIPLPGLKFRDLLPAFGAIAVWLGLFAVMWVPLLTFFSFSPEFDWAGSPLHTLARFTPITVGWRVLVDPIAVLAAGMRARYGWDGYALFVIVFLVAGVLVHQLSYAIERNQLRSRELEKLEQLGRALSRTFTDISRLPDVLHSHVSSMFPYAHVEIRLFPSHTILHHPEDWPAVDGSVWRWVRSTHEAYVFRPGDLLPWSMVKANRGVIVAPIVPLESEQPVTSKVIGGIYLSRYRDAHAIARLLPAVQSLAATVASTLHTAEVYAQTLEYHKMVQELELAGQIQQSFLPKTLPQIRGWQITAALTPALETSGDFYDVISLPNGRLGLLIADVADKGTGAALYMALSRTLIRTYALQYPRPDYVMRSANRRILMDTDAGLFVTVFYGVLEMRTGLLTYCNAGHNPPYWLHWNDASERSDAPPEDDLPLLYPLCRTGVPLGLFPGERWGREQVRLAPGDALVLYTDGVTDSENAEGFFFGKRRLQATIRENAGQSAVTLQSAVMSAVQIFVGDAPQVDDIAVMTVVRDLRRESRHRGLRG